MTFNLAARQKPKDISPNWITACSSPSSHNFQLDSLTAARSAGSQPANSPGCDSLSLNLQRACGARAWNKRGALRKHTLFFRGRLSTSCARPQSFYAHTLGQIYINYLNAHTINFISNCCNVTLVSVFGFPNGGLIKALMMGPIRELNSGRVGPELSYF